MATLTLFHDRLATTVLLFAAAVGIWGMFSFLRGQQGFSGSFTGALAIGWGLCVLQSAFGIALYAKGARPAESAHYLYGATAVIVTPLIWNYVKDRHPRQALFFLSLTGLFVAGLAIRGMATGG